MSADIQGDVLTITFPTGESSKVRVPRGERGPPGRDGMSIRGDKGEVGEKGDAGRDGRDSVVPGPKGDKGDLGAIGPCPKIRVGRVVTGEEAAVFLEGTPEEPIFNFVLPRGERGAMGPAGRDGKHGDHEFIQCFSAGSSPQVTEEMFARHVIADGIVRLPEAMDEAQFGTWIHFKTLDRLSIHNALEGVVVLEKNESAKMVVVPYQGRFVFTRF